MRGAILSPRLSRLHAIDSSECRIGSGRLLCALNADRHHGLAMFPIGQSPARRSGSEISDPVGRAGVDDVGRPFSGCRWPPRDAAGRRQRRCPSREGVRQLRSGPFTGAYEARVGSPARRGVRWCAGCTFFGVGNFQRAGSPTRDLIPVAGQYASGCPANGNIPGVASGSAPSRVRCPSRRDPCECDRSRTGSVIPLRQCVRRSDGVSG